MNHIPLSVPHLTGAEAAAVAASLADGWVAHGPDIELFERECAQLIGVPHAVALGSGTAAVHLALRVLGVARGAEVAVSDLTFAGAVNPIVYQGATPVFIDSEDRSWNMDPVLLETYLAQRSQAGKKVAAVVLVHLYGQCADVRAISRICRHYDVPLVEDAAEALGASCEGINAGAFGRIAAFSFNGNKLITSGGGGLLTSREEGLVEHARKLANQAREATPHYEHAEIGFNYRLSNVQAAIGRVQLAVVRERIAARRSVFEQYFTRLAHLPGLRFMPEAPWGTATRWLTCVTVDPALAGFDREALRLALAAAAIEARPVWKPMHLQPVFAGCEVFGGSVAARLFETGLCLPSGSNLSVAAVDRVCDVICQAWPHAGAQVYA